MIVDSGQYPKIRIHINIHPLKMKNSELEKLKAALKKCQDMEAGIAADKTLLAACAAERIALETSLNLADRRALTRVAQLQAMASFAPHRAELHQTSLENARQELVAASHEFIRTQLRPCYLGLRKAVNERLREKLQGHYQSESDLASAVNASGTMTALERLGTLSIIGGIRTEGCQEKAAKLIKVWAEVQQFEKAHLN